MAASTGNASTGNDVVKNGLQYGKLMTDARV